MDHLTNTQSSANASSPPLLPPPPPTPAQLPLGQASTLTPTSAVQGPQQQLLGQNPGYQTQQSAITTSVSASSSPRKKGRLQRSERLQSDSSASSYASWEALVRESFGQVAWPIKITSWELVDDRIQIVPTR